MPVADVPPPPPAVRVGAKDRGPKRPVEVAKEAADPPAKKVKIQVQVTGKGSKAKTGKSKGSTGKGSSSSSSSSAGHVTEGLSSDAIVIDDSELESEETVKTVKKE